MKPQHLPSGRWRAQVVIGYENGKPIRKSITADTAEEVEKLAQEAVKASCKPSRTFLECAEEYLAMKDAVLSVATIRGYKTILRNRLKPIEDRPIDAITQADIQKLVNDMTRNTSPKTIRNVYGFITAVFGCFCPDKTFSVTLPRNIRPDLYTPSDDEISLIVRWFSEHDTIVLRAVYLAAFGTLRRSEICAATAQDIEHNTLHVNKAMVPADGGEWITKCTKTASSDRTVILPQFVIDAMPSTGRLVPITPSALTNRFERGLANAGIHPMRFHALRSYAASIMHELGIPEKNIMAQGGWSNTDTLTRIYEKPLPDYHASFMQTATDHFTSLCAHEHDDLHTDAHVPTISTAVSTKKAPEPNYSVRHEGSSSGVRGIRTRQMIELLEEVERLENKYGVRLTIDFL